MDQGDYFAEGLDDRGGRGRIVTVGWTVRAQKAGALWAAPKPFEPHQGKPASSKSVQVPPGGGRFRPPALRHTVPDGSHFEVRAAGERAIAR